MGIAQNQINLELRYNDEIRAIYGIGNYQLHIGNSWLLVHADMHGVNYNSVTSLKNSFGSKETLVEKRGQSQRMRTEKQNTTANKIKMQHSQPSSTVCYTQLAYSSSTIL